MKLLATVSWTRRGSVKKNPSPPWNELPENFRRAEASHLINHWPNMSPEDREFVMSRDPDAVKAAGLWPGVPGDEELLRSIAERKASRARDGAGDSRRGPLPPRKPWHELPEDVRLALTESLIRQWPAMSLWHRRLQTRTHPAQVRAAELWLLDEADRARLGIPRDGRELPMRWDDLPIEVRSRVVGSLRAGWPNMQVALRQHIMENDPEMVRAAGLWPAESLRDAE